MCFFFIHYLFVRILFSYSKHYCLCVWFQFGLVYWFILSADVILVFAFGLCLGRSSLFPPLLLEFPSSPPCGLLPADSSPIAFVLFSTDSKHYCLVISVWFQFCLSVYIQKRTCLSKCVYFV